VRWGDRSIRDVDLLNIQCKEWELLSRSVFSYYQCGAKRFLFCLNTSHSWNKPSLILMTLTIILVPYYTTFHKNLVTVDHTRRDAADTQRPISKIPKILLCN